MGWDAETVDVVSVVGRDVHRVLRSIAPGHRSIVLSSDADTPGSVADLLVNTGHGGSKMNVLGDLGSDDETSIATTADEWARHRGPQLNAIENEVASPGVGGGGGGVPGRGKA